jgi:hypothetical protein
MSDKSKMKVVCFGRKVFMDKKSARFFWSIFNPTHHSLPFCLDFLAVKMDLVDQHCGRKFDLSDLSIPCQTLRKSQVAIEC